MVLKVKRRKNKGVGVCTSRLVLQEYIIDDGGGQKMGEFMRRAMAYNSVVNEHLVPLQDIFFGKVSNHLLLLHLVDEYPLSGYILSVDVCLPCSYLHLYFMNVVQFRTTVT